MEVPIIYTHSLFNSISPGKLDGHLPGFFLTIYTLEVITGTNLFLNIFDKVRPVGPMCSKHGNLNTTSNYPGIWALLSLDEMVFV